jgi:hypothetical protein
MADAQHISLYLLKVDFIEAMPPKKYTSCRKKHRTSPTYDVIENVVESCVHIFALFLSDQQKDCGDICAPQQLLDENLSHETCASCH